MIEVDKRDAINAWMYEQSPAVCWLVKKAIAAQERAERLKALRPKIVADDYEPIVFVRRGKMIEGILAREIMRAVTEAA